MTRRVPQQKPGKSTQEVGTPRPFLDAIEKRFGKIFFDLAADKSNAVAPRFYDKATNSLAQDWGKLGGTLYLNPEFGKITPWAKKASEQRDRSGWLLMLVPSSTGSSWFADHVKGKGFALMLAPRLVFNGHTQGYPKDLALVAYGFGVHGFDTWRWQEKKARKRL